MFIHTNILRGWETFLSVVSRNFGSLRCFDKFYASPCICLMQGGKFVSCPSRTTCIIQHPDPIHCICSPAISVHGWFGTCLHAQVVPSVVGASSKEDIVSVMFWCFTTLECWNTHMIVSGLPQPSAGWTCQSAPCVSQVNPNSNMYGSLW